MMHESETPQPLSIIEARRKLAALQAEAEPNELLPNAQELATRLVESLNHDDDSCVGEQIV